MYTRYISLLVFVKLWSDIILHRKIESTHPAKSVAPTWQLHEAADGAANKIHKLLAKAKHRVLQLAKQSNTFSF